MSQQTAPPGPGNVDFGSTAPGAAPEAEAELASEDTEELAPPSGNSRIWIVRVLSIIGVVGAWEILGRQVDPLFMSYPSAIAVAATHLIATPQLRVGLVSSWRTGIFTCFLASVIGTALGLLIGRYRMV